MDKLSKARNEKLPEFQKFLLEKKLVPENNIPFYAYWVSRYLDYARRHELSATEYQERAVIEYLNVLQSDRRVFKWQHRQADDALRLYYAHYLGKSGEQATSAAGPADVAGMLKEAKRLIRLKHYSYSTERTYLQWIERFLGYALNTEKKIKISDIVAENFKNFLSHLALKRKVSSSTQNQAFNAILFFFRNVLGKETGDLSKTVRAKRGQKLPAVFSVNEVKALFAHMPAKNLLIAELLYGALYGVEKVTRIGRLFCLPQSKTG